MDPVIDISVRPEPLPLFLRLVEISMQRWMNVLFQDPNRQETRIRVIPSAPTQFITLNLQTCSLHYIYWLLFHRLRDHSVCDQLARRIASEAERLWLHHRGFQMHLDVNVVRETFVVLGVARGINRFSDGGSGRGASDVTIEKLKKERSFRCCDETDQRDISSCSICLEDYSGADILTELPCSHAFHQSCVVQWLQTNNSCPLCRAVPSAEDAK